MATAPAEPAVVQARNAPARLRLRAGGLARASFGSTAAVLRITRALVANGTLSPDSGPPPAPSNGLTSADMGLFPHP